MIGRLSQRKAVQRLSGVSSGAVKTLLSAVGFGMDNTFQTRDLLADYSIRKTPGTTFSSGGAVHPTNNVFPSSAISPDGNWLAVVYPGGSPTPSPYIQMYKRSGKAWSLWGTLPGAPSAAGAYFALFSANSQRFRTLYGGTIYTWNLSGGSWVAGTSLYGGGSVSCLDESADGSILIAGTRTDQTYDGDGNPNQTTSVVRRWLNGVLQGDYQGAARSTAGITAWCSPLGSYHVNYYVDTGSNGIYWEGVLKTYRVTGSGGGGGSYQYGSTNNVRAAYLKPCWLAEDKFLIGSLPLTQNDPANQFIFLHLMNAQNGQPIIATPLKLCPWPTGGSNNMDIAPLGSNLYGICVGDGTLFVVYCDGTSLSIVGEGAKLFPTMKASQIVRA